ncbi:hypothetical protein [Sulfobacillus thermosulfidooxidans]|uniref:hypothetical protein n=1 Tax=Sulfobacillus thermosulfidooxidans TaxID=28034 RepID=UPI00031010FB|nr:hypothetical protein [Sulfobacillus thermosulfidooxidans]
MMTEIVGLGIVLGGVAAVWGIWDVLQQSATWGREQQTAFRRAVRKAHMAGRVPPDWDTWVAAQVEETREVLEALAPVPPVKRVAPVIPFPSPTPPFHEERGGR